MMDTSKIYRLLCICMVIQGYLCYSCNNGNCYSCPSSCVNCESDDYCKECKQGFYGKTCTETCKSYCRNNTCGKYSGYCETCENGYFLNMSTLCVQCPTNCLECSSKDFCSKCRTGFRGYTCHEECVNCKPGTACEKVTGYCMECNDGLSGESCNTKCSQKCNSCERFKQDKCVSCSHNRYGTNCEHECPKTCLTTCNITDGSCLHGCSSGYWGMMCNTSCPTNCKKGPCNKLYGSCTEVEKYPWYGFVYVTLPLVVLAVLAVLTVVICLKRRGACRRDAGSEKQQGAEEGLCVYYIDETDRKRAYILCKDPKSSEEISEFWQMVWNESCFIIVMLTGTDELPDVAYCPGKLETATYGNIYVKTAGITTFDAGVSRNLDVKQNEEEREVLQIQWKSTFSLNLEKIDPFRALVKKTASDKRLSLPVLIHSSNGVKKSGPYLALNMYLEKRESGQTETISDCFEFLKKQNLSLTEEDKKHVEILLEKMEDDQKDAEETTAFVPDSKRV